MTLPGKPDETRWVWLSHHRDLRVETDWLRIDDFSGPTLSANLGAFGNAHAGGGKALGRTRADTGGVAHWTVPGNHSGVLPVEAGGGKQAVAAILR